MKAIKGGKLSLAVITVITFLAFSHSASQAQPWVSIITEKGFNAEPVPAEKIPDTGSFWSFQRTNYPPLPFLNFPELPVYYLGYGNAFLVDDSTVDYQAIYEQREAERALRRLEIQYGLREPDEFDAEDGGGPMEAAYEYPASNYLWLEITSVTNGATPDGLAFVTLHGTVPGTAYELLSKEALTNTIWASEGIVIGAEDQDWTPTIVAVGSRTNSLFLWAKSWADSDGDGLPDWYENEVSGTDPWNPDTGNTGVSDGYKDGDNDGWTNLQEYQIGTSPVAFNTPPAPQGFNAGRGNGFWRDARRATDGLPRQLHKSHWTHGEFLQSTG